MIFLSKLLILLAFVGTAQAQTYVISTPQGYQAGIIQVQGNQATVVNNAGYPVQNITCLLYTSDAADE